MFKFVFSCQPLYYYIHKVLKRCPTERYIKPVRIPGYLWSQQILYTTPLVCSEGILIQGRIQRVSSVSYDTVRFSRYSIVDNVRSTSVL